MPRPQTKAEFITAAGAGWDKMWSRIDALSGDVQLADFCFGDDPKRKEAHWNRDLNLRGVLVHLHEWHKLLLDWAKTNLAGGNVPFLPEPYNWKTYGEMNVGFWEKHRPTSFDEARTLLSESHKNVLALIDTLTDDQLFEKKHFSWTGTSSLGSYCVSATSSHYDWAMKKIKLHAGTAAQK